MSPDLPARVPEGDGTGASVLADPLEGSHQVRLAVAPALLCMDEVKLLAFMSNLPKFWENFYTKSYFEPSSASSNINMPFAPALYILVLQLSNNQNIMILIVTPYVLKTVFSE